MAVIEAVNRAFDTYYNYSSNDAFYCLANPYEYHYYFNQVRLWDKWLQGKIEHIHNYANGILPTRLGNSISEKLSDLINGDGISYRSVVDKEKKSGLAFMTDNYEIKHKLSRVVKQAIRFSCDLGNSLIRVNADGDGELWCDAVAGNRFFVNLDSKGNVVKSIVYINILTTGANNDYQNQSYGLVEERYYNNAGKPCIQYKIYRLANVSAVFTPPSTYFSFEELPHSIQKQMSTYYKATILNNEQELPLRDLGVYLIKHTENVTSIPNLQLGESCLANIMTFLTTYDYVCSSIFTELYLGRARALIPATMAKGNNQGGWFNELDSAFYEKLPQTSDKDQHPTFMQPLIRSKELIELKEDCKKSIAAQLGISVTSLFSDLQSSGERVTATQVASSESNTIAFCTSKRQIALPEINKLIRTILDYYNYTDEVEAVFSDVKTSNESIKVQNIVALQNVRMESKLQALRDLHPNWTEDQIKQEYELLKEDFKDDDDILPNRYGKAAEVDRVNQSIAAKEQNQK